MSKKDIFKLYIPVILVAITASEDYMIPSFSIDDNGLFFVSNKTLNNTDFKGEPSYIAEVQASSNRINTEDSFSMNIFISGVGVIDFAKMRVNIPKYLVKGKYVKVEEMNFNYSYLPESNEINLNAFIETKDMEPPLALNIPDIYFNPRDINGFVNFGEVTLKEKDNPPYKIYFTIPTNAPAGDHNIHVNLFYKSDGKWYSDTQIVPLHINEWYENENWQIAICIALLMSIISAITSMISAFKKG